MRWNLENFFCRVPTLHIRLNRDQLGPTPATPVPTRGETARGVQIIRYKPVRQAHGRVVPVSKLLAWSKSSIRNMLHNRSYRAANNNVAEFVFIFRASSSDVWRWSKGTRSCRSVQWVVNVSDVCMLDMALKRFCRGALLSIDRTRGIKYLYTPCSCTGCIMAGHDAFHGWDRLTACLGLGDPYEIASFGVPNVKHCLRRRGITVGGAAFECRSDLRVWHMSWEMILRILFNQSLFKNVDNKIKNKDKFYFQEITHQKL